MVSEQVVRVPLSELATIRITCRRCEATVELAAKTLDSFLYRDYACPVCKQAFRMPTPERDVVTNHLTALVRVLEQVRQDAAAYEVEFVIKPAQ